MDQLFTESQRRVFRYFNGVADVYGDPVAIYRQLLGAFGGDLDLIVENSLHPAPEVSAPAIGRLVDAVRSAFSMVPFDPATGEGATEPDCLAALDQWRGWIQEKKSRAAS